MPEIEIEWMNHASGAVCTGWQFHSHGERGIPLALAGQYSPVGNPAARQNSRIHAESGSNGGASKTRGRESGRVKDGEFRPVGLFS